MTTEASQQPSEGPSRRRSVAILLFDDVEVLDFAGPFEVYGVARSADGSIAFKVVTIALDRGEITARNGLRIVPTITGAALGDIDILVSLEGREPDAK